VRTTLKNVLTGKVVDKTFNAGTKVEVATGRQAGDDLPLQGGHRLRLHGPGHLRPALRPGADARHGEGLPAREHGGDGRHARGRGALRRAARPASSCSSRTPTRACRATAPPAAPSRRPSRPAPRSRSAVPHHRREDQGRHPRRRYLGRVNS
jgi:hypothetical protein